MNVIITGSTIGMASATARKFSQVGHNVAAIARDLDRVAATTQELRSFVVLAVGIWNHSYVTTWPKRSKQLKAF